VPCYPTSRVRHGRGLTPKPPTVRPPRRQPRPRLVCVFSHATPQCLPPGTRSTCRHDGRQQLCGRPHYQFFAGSAEFLRHSFPNDPAQQPGPLEAFDHCARQLLPSLRTGLSVLQYLLDHLRVSACCNAATLCSTVGLTESATTRKPRRRLSEKPRWTVADCATSRNLLRSATTEQIRRYYHGRADRTQRAARRFELPVTASHLPPSKLRESTESAQPHRRT
jgi:hypothetical protein